MKKKIRYIKKFIMFIFVLTLINSKAHSHPHIWIDAEAKLIFNNDNKITKIEEYWEFDDIFSMSLMNDYDLNKDKEFNAEELKKLKENAFDGLIEYNFYTHLFIDDKKILDITMENFSAVMENDKVIYQFDIYPRSSLDPFKQNIDLGIYDSEYYIEISYKDHPLKTLGNTLECPHAIFEDTKHSSYMGFVNPKTIKVCRK